MIPLSLVSSALSALRTLNFSHSLIQKSRGLRSGNGSGQSTMDLDPIYRDRIRWIPIQAGRAGTVETLQHMRNLAVNAARVDRRFKDKGREFVSPGDFDFDLGGFDQWVRSVFTFRPEGEELLKDPILAMDEIEQRGYFDGDCDDVSMFYAAILRPFYPIVRFVAIRYDPSNPEFTHVFVEVSRHGHTFIKLDATVQPWTQHAEIERLVESC